MPRRKLIPLHDEDIDLSLLVPETNKFTVYNGGRKPPGDDWLSEMPAGAEFFVKAIKPVGQQMPSSFMVQYGRVISIIGPVRIIEMVQGEQRAQMPVDPKGFCETFALYHSPEREEVEEDEDE